MAMPVRVVISSHYNFQEVKKVLFLNHCWNYRRIIKLINTNQILHPAVKYWETRSKKIYKALRLHLKKTSNRIIPAHAYTRLGFGPKGFDSFYFCLTPKENHFLSVFKLNKLGSINSYACNGEPVQTEQESFLYKLASYYLYSESMRDLCRPISLGFNLNQIAPNAPPMAFNFVYYLIQTYFEGYHHETYPHKRSKTPYWT